MEITRDHFKTTRAVAVAYPPGAGGKILMNCLALSDEAVLQDQNLFDLSTVDIKNLLVERYSSINVQDQWNDANLCDDNLFGFDVLFHYDATRRNSGFSEREIQPLAAKHSYTWPYGKKFIEFIVNDHRIFFMVAHTAIDLHKHLEIWPKARVIILDNATEFIAQQRPNRLIVDNADYENHVEKCTQLCIDTSPMILDNLDWLEADLFVNTVEKCYNMLNLSGFNQNYIKEVFYAWDKVYRNK